MIKRILDKLFGCELQEQVGYYIEDHAIWRENTSYCLRCGEVAQRSRRKLREGEFWEDDALYLMPFADQKTI